MRSETESEEEHEREVFTAKDEAVAEKGLPLGIDVKSNAVSSGDTKLYGHDDAVSTTPVADAYKAPPQLSVAINQDAKGGAELTSQDSATVDKSHLDTQASQEKVSNMQQRIAQLEDEAKQTRGEMDQIRQENNELRHKLDSVQGDKNAAESTVSAQASTIGVLQATNDGQQRDLRETQHDLRATELALQVREEDLQETENSNTQLQSHVTDLKGRVADLRRDNAALEGQIAALEGQIAELEGQIAALKDDNFCLEAGYQASQRVVHQLNCELDQQPRPHGLPFEVQMTRHGSMRPGMVFSSLVFGLFGKDQLGVYYGVDMTRGRPLLVASAIEGPDAEETSIGLVPKHGTVKHRYFKPQGPREAGNSNDVSSFTLVASDSCFDPGPGHGNIEGLLLTPGSYIDGNRPLCLVPLEAVMAVCYTQWVPDNNFVRMAQDSGSDLKVIKDILNGYEKGNDNPRFSLYRDYMKAK